ncbi:MAG TPA: sugar kinase [Pedobacter sp.]|nr:sugar kinase [Pedobacter sp.]
MQDSARILVFGELLLRFSSSEDQFIAKNHTVSLYPGGSEANVSATLAQWKIPVSYLSSVPDNALAESALSVLSALGADTSKTFLQGSRIGLYFLLSSNGLTSGQVVYDRKYSSFSQLRPGMINWDVVMKDQTWFHWTALTPALNEHMAAVCLEALEAAQRNGLTISVDLNYRNRLWDFGQEPIDVIPELVKYCNVIMGNIWAANKMLGTSIDESLNRNTNTETYYKHAEQTASEIFKSFPACRHVANTFRFMDNPEHNLFYGTYHTPDAGFISEIYETNAVADRIGSGDAFMAGLIYGIINFDNEQDIIERATGAGYQKLFTKGDFGNGSF